MNEKVYIQLSAWHVVIVGVYLLVGFLSSWNRRMRAGASLVSRCASLILGKSFQGKALLGFFSG